MRSKELKKLKLNKIKSEQSEVSEKEGAAKSSSKPLQWSLREKVLSVFFLINYIVLIGCVGGVFSRFSALWSASSSMGCCNYAQARGADRRLHSQPRRGR